MTQLHSGVEAVVDRLAASTTDVSQPTLDSFADRTYDAVLPLAWLDADTDWHLALLCASIGVMFQAVDDVARDTPDAPGWSAVLDLDRCPDDWLGWLAQFVGVIVPTGTDAATARSLIIARGGFQRGTVAAVQAAAAATLTGTKTVLFRERTGGDAYALQVVTLTKETPDAAVVRAALLAAKPGGLVLDYHTIVGWDYTQMTTEGGAYSVLPPLFFTYADLRDNVRH